MFIPNTRANLHSRKTVKDNFGKYLYTAAISVPCAIVYLNVAVAQSSVRADTSGTRGQSEQNQGDARFLFPKSLKLKVGDVIFKDDHWLEVTEVTARRNVIGKLDHHQVEFRKVEPIL